MPRPRTPLPAPCPKCGSTNGKVQLVIFNPKFHKQKTYRKRPPRVILRIGHYSPKVYKDTQEKVASPRLRPYIRQSRKNWYGTRLRNKNLTEGYVGKRHRERRSLEQDGKSISLIPKESVIIKPWADKWHNFVIKDSIMVEVIDYYQSKRDIKTILIPIEKVFQKRYGNDLYESKTFPLSNELFDRYKTNGWPI
jgi:hypothetical protein